MKFRLFMIIAFLLVSINIATAADDKLAPWPIVKRCLPTPIVPDKNWSYDGEIMMSGWAGIHAIHAGSPTPGVIHWGYGLLSPDGQWVLSQKVDSYTEQLTGGGPMGRYIDDYSDIIVENLKTQKKIKFAWQAHIEISSSPYPFGPAGPLWLDNDRFLSFYGAYGKATKEANIKTEEIIDLPAIDLDDNEYSISPDLTRAISYAQLYDLTDNKLVSEEKVGTVNDFQSSVWTNESSMFIDRVQGTNNTSTLTIFNRDGMVISKPFVNQDQRIVLGQFSPENNYFSFTEYSQRTYKNHPYVLDMTKYIVYDLCADDAQGLAWSPDGTQFATILGQGQRPIVVVDMDDWQPRIIGYHTGSVLLWRSLP